MRTKIGLGCGGGCACATKLQLVFGGKSYLSIGRGMNLIRPISIFCFVLLPTCLVKSSLQSAEGRAVTNVDAQIDDQGRPNDALK